MVSYFLRYFSSTSTEQISPDSAGPFTSFDPVGFAIFTPGLAAMSLLGLGRVKMFCRKGLGWQMDRIDAMKVFVTAVDEGSLAGAARRLKRSPTAVSRALSFLEARLGVELLHRTTRTLKLSEAGERYAAACRRVLTDLNEADMLASGERSYRAAS